MFEAAPTFGAQRYEYLLPVAPTLKDSQVQCTRPGGPSKLECEVVHDARAVLHHARASVVASGTATVEAALIGNPFCGRLPGFPGHVRRGADVWCAWLMLAMVNLIAGRRIVPELIQHDFTASKVLEQLRPLLENEQARATMQSDLRSVEAALKVSGDGKIPTAIGRAAQIALQLIPSAPQPRLQSAFVSSWPAE